MIFITFYIIGVIISFFIIAYNNDKNKQDDDLFWVLFSWFIVFIYIGIFLRDYKPTLKIFKRNKK